MPPGNRATATAPICGERKNMKVKRIIMMVLAGMLMACGLGYSQNNNKIGKRIDGELIDAVSALDEGQYKEAQVTLERILTADPRNDAAQYYLGMCRLYANDLDGAKTAFKKASELDPGNFWYRERLARTYSLTGEDDLTIATYEALLKDYPKKNDIYFTLVNLYLKQSQYDKALGALDQIEAVFGKSENVTATKYDILLRQNKPEEAFKVLTDFNKEFSSPYVLTKLGDHSMAEYKDTAALAYYQEALDLQGGYMPALLGESEVYRTRRNFPEFFKTLNRFMANDETDTQIKTQYLNMLVTRTDHRFLQSVKPQIDSLYDNLVAHHPTDSTALMAAGLYWYSSGKADKAKDLIHKNMALYPDNLEAAIAYAQLLVYMKQWGELESECDSAMARFPKETVFLDIKNLACFNRKDWHGIIDNNKRIIEIAQGDTSLTIPALATIGDMYHELGKEKEAFKVYTKVLKLNPDYAPALNNYAYYLALKGTKLKKACAMSRKTVEKEPDNPTYLDTYGWILHLLKRDKEAKAQFKHAMLYGGKESATCLEHYSIVLEALGETDLAKVYKTQAENKKAEGKE